MRTVFENYRIFLSRIAAAIALFFICTTASYWESHSKILTHFLFCSGIVFVGIASLGRMWCSVYIAGYKNNKLVTQGPYSISRNPLYFFSLIGAVGIGCTTETLTFPIAFLILFAMYYPFVVKSEEKRLQELFGEEFAEYKKRVPAFFPRLSIFQEPENYSVNPRVYRKHMFSALWFIWIVGILELIEGMQELGWIKAWWSIF